MDLFPGREEITDSKQKHWAQFGIKTRLAAARRHRGYSQDEFAEKAGVSQAQLRRYERGGAGGSNPSLRFMINAALILDVPLAAIVPDEACQYIDPKTERPAPVPKLKAKRRNDIPSLPPLG